MGNFTTSSETLTGQAYPPTQVLGTESVEGQAIT